MIEVRENNETVMTVSKLFKDSFLQSLGMRALDIIDMDESCCMGYCKGFVSIVVEKGFFSQTPYRNFCGFCAGLVMNELFYQRKQIKWRFFKRLICKLIGHSTEKRLARVLGQKVFFCVRCAEDISLQVQENE